MIAAHRLKCFGLENDRHCTMVEKLLLRRHELLLWKSSGYQLALEVS